MSRTELTERIAGEAVRVAVTIGVLEAVAEIEPEMIAAMAKLQRGHLRLTRVVIIEGMRAAGGAKDVDRWYDAAVERAGLAPFTALAFRALSDAFAKASDNAGKAEAATETERAS